MKKITSSILLMMFMSLAAFANEPSQTNEIATSTTLTYKKNIEVGVLVLQNGQYVMVNAIYELEITAVVEEFSGFQTIQSFKVNPIYSPSISITDKQAWIDISSNNGIISWAVWLTHGPSYTNVLETGNISYEEFVNGANSGPGGPPRF
ncbi:MAG: hypothetical protein JJ978_02530 [Roseivirga sp.]|jgi:hypothetical protein|uniref:hypothetical protein n=1 Tax=Roseivirga sp. TaxID=1964215 RepID=UPI001B2AADE2|nr:hypothetical protein [Roseivirga sp.]MBO6494416.1 hypothetical protein [Roseivirga sp.]